MPERLTRPTALEVQALQAERQESAERPRAA